MKKSSKDATDLDPESPTVMEGPVDDGSGEEVESGKSAQEVYERGLLEKKRLEEEEQKKKIEVLEKMLADMEEKSDQLRSAKKYPEAIQLWVDIVERFTEKKEFHRPQDLERAQSPKLHCLPPSNGEQAQTTLERLAPVRRTRPETTFVALSCEYAPPREGEPDSDKDRAAVDVSIAMLR